MRLAVIMRGLPGSGKSWQARAICDQHLGHLPDKQRYLGICSTDAYFYKRGRYCFDGNRLGEYHAENLKRFISLLGQKRPVVICDNTNMRLWELRPYLSAALSQGYKLQIVEVGLPVQEPWLEVFAKRNSHGVPIEVLQRMAGAYEPSIGNESVKVISKAPYL